MKKTMVKTAYKYSHPFPRYTGFCRPTDVIYYYKSAILPAGKKSE